MKKAIKGPGIKQPKNIISSGVEVGNFVFVSGQTGRSPETGEIVSDKMEPQAEQALKNIGNILTSVGTSFENLLWCIVFLKDLNDGPKFNEVWNRVFAEVEVPPARASVQVADLSPGILAEIVCIACKED